MALDMDQLVSSAFNAAPTADTLANVTAEFNNAVALNPWLANATTGEARAAVVSALGDHDVMVIMDNHISHAGWCCSLTDGNGWWSSAAGYNATNVSFS